MPKLDEIEEIIRSNPHLPVKNIREMLSCYRDVLGFYDEWTWIDKNGQEIDAGIRLDEL